MDIIDDDFAADSKTSLEDLLSVNPNKAILPQGTIKNKAAIGAMLTSKTPEDLIPSYQSRIEAANSGEDGLQVELQNQIEDSTRQMSMQEIVKVLGDSTLSLDQKQRAMNVVQKGNFKEDPSVTLELAALQEVSTGEDLQAEGARLSMAETVAKREANRAHRQKLWNSKKLELTNPAPVVMGAAAIHEFAPFAQNILHANVKESLKEQQGKKTSVFQWIKDFALPETTMNEMRDEFAALPLDQQQEWVEQLTRAIDESGVIIPSASDYSQATLTRQILEEGSSSTAEEVFGNMFTLLDFILVGSAGRSAVKAIRGKLTPAKVAEEGVSTVVSEQRVAASKPDAPVPSGQTPMQAQRTRSQMEDELASALGEAGNKVDKGVVASLRKEVNDLKGRTPNTSETRIKEITKQNQDAGMKFKDARAKANAQISDEVAEHQSRLKGLEAQIAANAKAAEAEKKIASLEKEIAASRKAESTDAADRVHLNSITRMENPSSPLGIIEHVNPSKAKVMHEAIINGSDEVAEALAGTNRQQALTNMVMPQVGVNSGNILYKANPELASLMESSGGLRYTAGETQSAIDSVKRDFKSASGLEANDAMTGIRADGDKLVIDAHYSRAGGNFSNAQEAKDQATVALARLGVSPEDITVMKRDGIDFRPLTDKEIPSEVAGDYMVRVQTRRDILDEDVTNWDVFDVRANWFDRISHTGSEEKGSITGWLATPSVMFDKAITGSLSTATDQVVAYERALLQPIKELRKLIDSFPKDRIRALEDYFIEANTKGLKYDPADLISRGFKAQEVEAVRQWRGVWDAHYYLENLDMVRTTRNHGYQVLDVNGTFLVGKRVEKNQNIAKVYDPSTDTIVSLSKAEMDNLYNTGGHYAGLRRPMTVNGVQVEHMMVRNTASEHLRSLKDTDSLLNYRDGYFAIQYKAPHFIDEVRINAQTGEKEFVTVAVAGDMKEADSFIKSQSRSTGNEYIRREDDRGFRKESDTYWDLNEAGGRLAQRRRGQPLVEASGSNTLNGREYIANPMESAMRSAQSIAGRTVMRPALDTAKRRFVEQYGDILQSRNPIGGVSYPTHRGQIVDKVSNTSKRAADARSTYTYLNQVERGLINSADQVFKGSLNILADGLGKLGLSKGERVARAIGDINPTTAAKSTVFHAYISTSIPIRQWIVQSHQAGRMVAYNPIGMANGGVAKNIAHYTGDLSGIFPAKSPDAQAFVDFVNRSGMMEGVDRNSLVRGIGLDMADSSSKLKRGIGAVAHAPQQLGFNVGEKANMLGHLAAVYEKYKRDGRIMADPTVRDEAYSTARALSYGMNKADEFHYTGSSAAAILQFLQMPQKALLQVADRRIPVGDRLRVMGYDTLMWGGPTGLIGYGLSTLGVSPEDEPKLYKALTDGLEPLALNHLINLVAAEYDENGNQIKTEIDFASLRPIELDGWAKMYSAMMEDGLGGLLAAAPAGNLFAVAGMNGEMSHGRIAQAFVTMGRFGNVFDEVDPNNPTAFKDVLTDALKISSGWSAVEKASLMYEANKIIDAQGRVFKENVNAAEIAFQVAGFAPKAASANYTSAQTLFKNKEEHEERLNVRYREIMKHVTDRVNADATSVDHMQRVSSVLLRTFNHPGDLEYVQKKWARDLGDRDSNLTKTIMRQAELGYDGEKVRQAIRESGLEEGRKQQLFDYVTDYEQAGSKLINEGNK